MVLVKNHKIDNNSTTTEDREKIRADVEFYRCGVLQMWSFRNSLCMIDQI
jgi:hypothetical protein